MKRYKQPRPHSSTVLFASVAALTQHERGMPAAAVAHLGKLADHPLKPITAAIFRQAVADFGDTHQKLGFQRDPLCRKADEAFSALVQTYIRHTGDVDLYADLPKGCVLDLQDPK